MTTWPNDRRCAARTSTTRQRLAVTALLCGSLGALTGCAQGAPTSDTDKQAVDPAADLASEPQPAPPQQPDLASVIPAPKPVPKGAEIPAFTGSNAAAFDTTYRDTTSEMQREMLADGKLHWFEVEMLSLEVELCLAEMGVWEYLVRLDGTRKFVAPQGMPPGEFASIRDACRNAHMGPVAGLNDALNQDA